MGVLISCHDANERFELLSLFKKSLSRCVERPQRSIKYMMTIIDKENKEREIKNGESIRLRLQVNGLHDFYSKAISPTFGAGWAPPGILHLMLIATIPVKH